jgi:hypothetical protein
MRPTRRLRQRATTTSAAANADHIVGARGPGTRTITNPSHRAGAPGPTTHPDDAWNGATASEVTRRTGHHDQCPKPGQNAPGRSQTRPCPTDTRAYRLSGPRPPIASSTLLRTVAKSVGKQTRRSVTATAYGLDEPPIVGRRLACWRQPRCVSGGAALAPLPRGSSSARKIGRPHCLARIDHLQPPSGGVGPQQAMTGGAGRQRPVRAPPTIHPMTEHLRSSAAARRTSAAGAEVTGVRAPTATRVANIGQRGSSD